MEDLIRKKDAMKPLLLAYREIQRQARESDKKGDAAVSYIFGALSGVFRDQICWAMEAPASSTAGASTAIWMRWNTMVSVPRWT